VVIAVSSGEPKAQGSALSAPLRQMLIRCSRLTGLPSFPFHFGEAAATPFIAVAASLWQLAQDLPAVPSTFDQSSSPCSTAIPAPTRNGIP